MRLFGNLLLICALMLPLAACENPSAPAPKIGIVDVNRLMRDCNMGKAGLKQIEDLQAKMQKQLDDIQTKLEKNPADEGAMRELQKVYATSQQQIQAEGENIVSQIMEAVQGAMDEFRQKNGYAILLRQEAADAFDPALDVTSAMLAEVNKIRIDFKPLPSAPEAAAAESGQKEDTAPVDNKNADSSNSTETPQKPADN